MADSQKRERCTISLDNLVFSQSGISTLSRRPPKDPRWFFFPTLS